MFRYLMYLLFGRHSCAACHQYIAAADALCLYCELKARLIRRAV